MNQSVNPALIGQGDQIEQRRRSMRGHHRTIASALPGSMRSPLASVVISRRWSRR